MAVGRIVLPPYFPARNRDGTLVPGARLTVWNNKTTTKAEIYADAALSTVLPNPVTANSSGRFPDVFAPSGTDVSPVLYSLAVTANDGKSIGNPSVFDNYRPSVDYETAALALALDAATAAQVSASDASGSASDASGSAMEAAGSAANAQDALQQIEEIASGSPDAPSVLNKANKDGGNVGPLFAENARIQASGASAVERPLADKLDEVLSLADYASLNAALVQAGDRGRPVRLPANGVLNIPTAPVVGVFTLYAEGPYTRTGAYNGDIGGKLVQVSGTGLLYDPFYIGQHPNKDGTFKFEAAFRALAPDEGTGLRTLSTATLAVSSPNGSNAGVFTSRSSDGGSIGSGFALAAYVINDRPYLGPESPAHGMWLFQGIAVREPLAGTTFGMEPGVVNKGSIENRTPYSFYGDGLTANLWLASGLPYLTTNPISMYIGCVYNGSGAQRGIVFEKRSLVDMGGGYGEAISVPEKTYFAQYVDLDDGGPGIIGATIGMGVTTYELGSRLTLDDAGVSIRGLADGVLWSNVNGNGFSFGPDGDPYIFGSPTGLTVKHGGLVVGGIGSASNFTVLASETNTSRVEVLGGEPGGFPTIRAAGPAARIPLLLAGKGGSGIQFSVDYPFAADDAAAAALGVGPFESYINTSNQNALTVLVP